MPTALPYVLLIVLLVRVPSCCGQKKPPLPPGLVGVDSALPGRRAAPRAVPADKVDAPSRGGPSLATRPPLYANCVPHSVNIAVGKKSEFSSVFTGSDPACGTLHCRAAAGNDGKLSTLASSAAEPYPFYEIDLGHLIPISQVVVHNRFDCCQERLGTFYLFASNSSLGEATPSAIQGMDSPPWFQRHSFTEFTSAGSLNVTLKQRARVIRLQLDSSQPQFLQLQELQVFPCAGQRSSIGNRTRPTGSAGATLLLPVGNSPPAQLPILQPPKGGDPPIITPPAKQPAVPGKPGSAGRSVSAPAGAAGKRGVSTVQYHGQPRPSGVSVKLPPESLRPAAAAMTDASASDVLNATSSPWLFILAFLAVAGVVFLVARQVASSRRHSRRAQRASAHRRKASTDDADIEQHGASSSSLRPRLRLWGSDEPAMLTFKHQDKVLKLKLSSLADLKSRIKEAFELDRFDIRYRDDDSWVLLKDDADLEVAITVERTTAFEVNRSQSALVV